MLSKEQKKYLRSLAHNRNVIIRVGQNGLTGNVIDEINTALDHHELVKASIRVGDRQERDRVTAEICKSSDAEIVQKIGNTVVLYRRNNKEPVITLP